jgi:YcxB-like protein
MNQVAESPGPGPGPACSIELSNGAASLKEIYYANGKGKIFSYPPNRDTIRMAVGLGVTSQFFYFLSSSNKIGFVVCFALALIAATIYLGAFLWRANKYLKWKKGVDAYLRLVDELGNQQLRLTTLTFELINKKETVIEKWSNIKKVHITPACIYLFIQSGESYMFPGKAMDQSDYQLLQGFIRQGMHSGQVIDETT